MGLFDAIGSVVGDLVGANSTKKTNANNMAINQMNNEFNAAEAEKARNFQTSEREATQDWNLEMWNKQNEYNDPSAERARLSAAGYNPFFSGVGSNVAGSVQSSSTPSAAQASASSPAQQVPFHPRMQLGGLDNALQEFADLKARRIANKREALNLSLDTQFGPDYRRSQIANLLNGNFEYLNPAYRKGRYASAPDLLGINLQKQAEDLRSLQTSIDTARAEGSLTYLKAESQRILNRYMPLQQQVEVVSRASRIFSDYASGKLSLSKARTEVANQLLIGAETAGKKLSNQVAQKTAASLIDSMREENRYNQRYYHYMHKAARDLIGFDYDTAKYGAKEAFESYRLRKKERRWHNFNAISKSVGSAAIGASVGRGIAR